MSKIKVASGEVFRLKTNFEVSDRLGAFYKGGPVQLSQDGRHLFTTCENSVKVVSCDSGRVEHSVEEEEDHVTCFVASADGEWLVVGWRSLLLKQYGTDSWKCTRTWKGHTSPVMAMAFDGSSTLLATGGSDSVVNVWDIQKQYCTHNLRGSQGVVNLVKFHPDPQVLRLFSCSADCNVRVWDLGTSKCVMVLKNHVSAVTGLGFSVDGQTLLSCGRDQVVHVWDLATGTAHKTMPVFESVEGLVVLSPTLLLVDGPVKEALSAEKAGKKSAEATTPPPLVVFATAGSKGVIRVWSTRRPHPLYTLEPLAQAPSSRSPTEEEEGEESMATEVEAAYTGLHYNESLDILAAVTYDHNIVFCSGQQFHRMKQFIGYLDEVLDMKFVGEGEGSLAVATNSEQVKVFDRNSFSCQLLSGHSGIVLALDAGTDGTLLATSSKDNTVRLWSRDSASGNFECVAMGTGHTHAVGAVAVSRVRGNFVVSGSQDSTVKMWSLKGVFKEARRREVVRLKVKYTQLAHNKDINSLDVSPNDKLLVSASQDKTAKLWQAADGILLGTFHGHRRGVWSAKFSPVDQCVVTASGDGTVKLWAIGDHSCIKTFEGHTSSVLKAVFLTRGMQIASSGSDGLVKLWTIKTNECVATLDEHTEKIWSLTTSSDGDVLVSGGADSLVCQWKDITERVEEEAAADRELQLHKEQELSNLLHRKDYVRAVGVAISLDQPNRVRTILQELLDKEGTDGNFAQIVQGLREDQLCSILKFANRWNQNSRHSHVAQSVVGEVLRCFPSDQLLGMEDIKVLLEGLIPYTERHFQRLTRLQQLSKFVDYTLQCIKLPALLPTPGGQATVEPMEMGPVTAIADSTSGSQESMVEGITEDDACDDPVTSTTTDHAATPVGHVTSSPDLVTPCAGSDLETADELMSSNQKKYKRLKTWKWCRGGRKSLTNSPLVKRTTRRISKSTLHKYTSLF